MTDGRKMLTSLKDLKPILAMDRARFRLLEVTLILKRASCFCTLSSSGAGAGCLLRHFIEAFFERIPGIIFRIGLSLRLVSSGLPKLAQQRAQYM